MSGNFSLAGLNKIFQRLIVAANIIVAEISLVSLLDRLFQAFLKDKARTYTLELILVGNVFMVFIFFLKRNKGKKERELSTEEWHLEKNKRNRFIFLYSQMGLCILVLYGICINKLVGDVSLWQGSISFIVYIALLSMSFLLKHISVQDAKAVREAYIDQRYKEEMRDFIQVLRAQRHDFNFHIESILGMIEAENYEACQAYLQAMLNETHTIAQVMPLSDPAVSALLYMLRESAEKKGIKIDFFIHYDMSEINCTVYEINKILGNLIQNAMDETEGNEESDAWIHVTILKKRNYCIIRVTNPAHHAMLMVNEFFEYGFSTKKNHSGIGLNTVMKIVSACNGTVFPEFEEGVVTFIVQIPIIE